MLIEPSLPTEILPRRRELYQDNVLTEAKYEMTEVERNILYMVLQQIRRDDPYDTLYTLTIKEIADVMQRKMNNEAYRAATKKLISRVVEITMRDGSILQVSFASSVRYVTGKGLIEIRIDPAIRQFYVDLKERFTKIQLDSALRLQSMYAKRIYELLCMVKNMKNKTFIRPVVELKSILGLIDKDGKDKYPDYYMFKKRVLDIAMNEINGSTDLTFTYEEKIGEKVGKGRKPVESIKFEVFYQNQTNNEELPIYERLTNQFKLRKDQAIAAIENFSEEKLNRILYDIQIQVSNNQVKSIGAYTAKTLGL